MDRSKVGRCRDFFICSLSCSRSCRAKSSSTLMSTGLMDLVRSRDLVLLRLRLLSSTTIPIQLLLNPSLSLSILFADLFETGFSACLVLLPLLLQPRALLFLLPVHALPVFPSALFFCLVALLTLFAPAFLLGLALLLPSFVLLLFSTFALLFLCPLFSLNLAFVLEFLLPDGFSLVSPGPCTLASWAGLAL
jgi:hypothetical protein